MKKVQTLALALALVAVGSVSWAATSLNSSRVMQKKPPETMASNLNSSRSNVYRVIVEKNVVSSEQVTAILRELDKFKGAEVELAKVKTILETCGVRADMKVILYQPKTPKGTNFPTYILLADPKNKPAAMVVSDEESKSNASERVASDKDSPKVTGELTAKVTGVDPTAKTFTVLFQNRAITFSAAKLSNLPTVGKSVAVAFTANPGELPVATSLTGSGSNARSTKDHCVCYPSPLNSLNVCY